MKIKNLRGIVVFIVISQAVGVMGSIFTMPAIHSWYVHLHKSPLNPPAWVFGPVWFLLYTMMGVAAAQVSQDGFANRNVRNATVLFFTQLMLNLFWSVIFFGMKLPKLALLEIIVLWSTVLVTTVCFFRIRQSAGWLLVPYLVWCSYAAILNFEIVRLN
jgi:tryptophan-rich sensory protein